MQGAEVTKSSDPETDCQRAEEFAEDPEGPGKGNSMKTSEPIKQFLDFPAVCPEYANCPEEWNNNFLHTPTFSFIFCNV